MKKILHIGFFFFIASILISIAVHYYSFNSLVWALYALSLNFVRYHKYLTTCST